MTKADHKRGRRTITSVLQCGGTKDKHNTYDKKKKNKPKKVMMKNVKSKEIVLNSNDLRFPVGEIQKQENLGETQDYDID